MTQQNISRRQDQPIQIGLHGYQIEGDHASINAELQVPPHHAGGDWTLELWATDQAYREGALTGLKIAEIPVALPTPIGPYLHQVDVRTSARLPLQGRAHAMVLALIQRDSEGQPSIGAFANYAERQTFIAPHITGRVGYQVQGKEVVLEAEGIFNPRIDGNVSGTLSLELWAFPESGASPDGLRLAAAEVGTVSGQYWLPAIERRVALSEPPAGRYRMAMLLCEWTAADGYVARDRHDLASIYERAPAETLAASPAPASIAPPAPKQPAETVAKVATPVETPSVGANVPAAAPAAAASAAASRLVSIQTASVDELAKVEGLNLKIAREIVKARPFTSLADLSRVRSLGDSALKSLKGLLTL